MSAQKQCPKCGEKNPAEAVMCWACYTSLTGGGAGAAALAGVGGPSLSGSTPMTDSAEKKSIDPKQLAIIGVGLLVALGFGVKTMIGGSEPGTDPLPSGGLPTPNKGNSPSMAQQQTNNAPTTNVGNPVSPSPPTSGDVKAVEKMPYTVISAPSLRYAGATLAIIPTQNNVGIGEAKALATRAYTQVIQQKKWSPVEIFVFNDEKAAQILASYQAKRRGAPLAPADYTSPELVPCWKQVILRQRSDGKNIKYSEPQANPTDFWNSDTKG